jgi:Zn-dependent protease
MNEGICVTIENETDFAPVIVEEEKAPTEPRIFYKIDSLRVTLPEYAHGAGAIVMVPAVLLHKLFRTQIPSSADDPTVHTLSPFEVPQEQFPADVYERMSPLVRELEELGFTTISYHDIDDGLHLTRTFLITLINPASPNVVARVHLRIWIVRQPARVALFSEFITGFADGTFLWSASSKPDWRSPTSIEVIRRPDLAPAPLLQLHEEALRNQAQRTALTIDSPAAARELTEKHHAAIRDFHLHRGVFVPRTESDQAQAMRVEKLTQEGNPHAAVLIELERVQKRRTSWASAILILVVSLGLFIGVGATRWNWEFLWMLLVILAFHELGHYIAMRAFGYRNVRMFFIPLMGAAVSGQNYTAPAWKKVLVALAGPLPGIIVGIALGCAGWYWHKTMLFDAAVLTLIINGLNLLPVLPLDGGRVAHTLLFSRHYILDLGFRAVAGAVLLVAGFFTSDRVLQMLGVLLLINVPSAYRLAKIASDLRRAGVGPGEAADTFVPTSVATAIIDRLKGALSKNTSNKLLAQQTLSVYETIATKRAGWPATIGFLVLHGFALLLVGVSLAVFMFGQHGGFKAVQQHSIQQVMRESGPKIPVSSATIASDGVANTTTAPAYTLVATFDTPAASRAVLSQISAHLGTTAAATRFGNSVIVAVYDPSDLARRRWVDRLEPYKPKLAAVSSASQVLMTLQCTTADEAAAERVAEELQGYLGAPRAMALIPPWSPDDHRPAELQRKHEIARHTYAKLQTSRYGDYGSPEMRSLNDREQAALAQGDAAVIAGLVEERKQLMQQLAVKSANKLKLQSSQEIDAGFVDAYLAATDQLKIAQPDDRHAVELGARLGQLPLSGTQPSSPSLRYSTRYGYTGNQGTLISLTCSFVSPIDGAPALVQWLESHGCTHITYEFHPQRLLNHDIPDEDMMD